MNSELKRKCAACGAEIRFVTTGSGRLMPTDADGTSHFKTCTDPDRFSRRTVKRRDDAWLRKLGAQDAIKEECEEAAENDRR